ncbi:MAG: hypothetical protein LBB05_03180, partial [Puniceicoccales bacterium]|nr:hypothetical protein [Puniceicoccales bacterium]
MIKRIQKKLLGCTGCGLLMVMGSLSHVVRGSQSANVPKQRMIPLIASRVIERTNRREPPPIVSARVIKRRNRRGPPPIVSARAKKKTSNNPNGDAWCLPIVRGGNPNLAESVDDPFAKSVGDPRLKPSPMASQSTNVPEQRVSPLVIQAIDLHSEPLPMTPAMAMERIPNDPNGDTWYLHAVRTGNLRLVELFLGNPHLNLDAVDGNGNTDLMLAIMGEGQMNYGLNRQTIFYLIFRFRNRNWNLRNRWGQTA